MKTYKKSMKINENLQTKGKQPPKLFNTKHKGNTADKETKGKPPRKQHKGNTTDKQTKGKQPPKQYKGNTSHKFMKIYEKP